MYLTGPVGLVKLPFDWELSHMAGNGTVTYYLTKSGKYTLNIKHIHTRGLFAQYYEDDAFQHLAGSRVDVPDEYWANHIFGDNPLVAKHVRACTHARAHTQLCADIRGVKQRECVRARMRKRYRSR